MKSYGRHLVTFAFPLLLVGCSKPTPEDFIQTNIVGTYCLLEESRRFWMTLSNEDQNLFRFHHVSTDEVFGDLAIGEKPFDEESSYAPSSPYSSSKASSDHLVRAWHETYSLPIVLTNWKVLSFLWNR